MASTKYPQPSLALVPSFGSIMFARRKCLSNNGVLPSNDSLVRTLRLLDSVMASSGVTREGIFSQLGASIEFL